MAERKVVNKYYPPDFDPAKLPRRRMPKNQQLKVRMMLPMSIRCNTCGNYISKGTKFNSRKEEAVGETYLGIKIFRLYCKCTKCSAEIIMKTDPGNSDYTVESGAARNFEPWRAEEEVVEEKRRKRNAEEMGDAMKSLENRARDSKRQMDIISAIDETKSLKSRQALISVDSMLEALQRSAPVQQEKALDEDDEALIKMFVMQKRKVSHEDYDKPEDYLQKTSTIDRLSKKSSGRIFLKSSTIKFNVVKKALEAKTQREEIRKRSTGLECLIQYDNSDEE